MFGVYGATKRLFNLFKSALDPIISQLKTKEGRDRATHALASVINLGEKAVPVVRTALAIGERVTGVDLDNPLTQHILDAAAKYGLRVEEALAEPDEFARMGKLIRIEGEGLRNTIAALLPEAEHGVQIGETLVRSIEELNLIPRNVLEAAVHNAHVALAAAGEIVKQPPILTAAPPSHAEVNLEL